MQKKFTYLCSDWLTEKGDKWIVYFAWISKKKQELQEKFETEFWELDETKIIWSYLNTIYEWIFFNFNVCKL